MDEEMKKEIARKCTKRLIDVAKVVLLGGKLHAAEQFLIIAKRLSCDDDLIVEINATFVEIEAKKLEEINLDETRGNTDKSGDKSGLEHFKYEDISKNKDPVVKHSLADKHAFLMRRNVLWKAIFEMVEVETEATQELKNEIRKYSDMAHQEFEENNFDTAQQHLLHAESIHSKLLEQIKGVDPKSKAISDEKDNKYNVNTEKYNEKESNDVQQRKSAPISLTFKGKEGDEIKCIEIAQKAIDAGNIEKAKKFLLKSERIFPTDNAKKMLKQLHDSVANNDYKNRDDKIDPDTTDKQVKHPTSINEGTQRVTVKYSDVLKGVVLDKTVETSATIPKHETAGSGKDRIVKAVSGTSVHTTKSHDFKCVMNKTPASHHFSEPSSNFSKHNREKCTQTDKFYVSAGANGKLPEARNVSTKSDDFYGNRMQSNQSYNKHQNSSIEEEAFELRKKAKTYYKSGDFVNTKRYLLELQKLKPSDSIEDLLKQIEEVDFETYLSSSVSTLKSQLSSEQNPRELAAKCYKEAQYAYYTAKNFDKAEELLLEAEKLAPCVRQNVLLRNVRDAKAAAENSRNIPRSSRERKDQPSNNPHGSKTSNTPSKLHTSQTINRNYFPSKMDVQSEHSAHTLSSSASGYPKYGKNSEESAAALNRRRFAGTEFPKTHHASTRRADVHATEKEVEDRSTRALTAFNAQDYDTAQNLRPSYNAGEFLMQIRDKRREKVIKAKIDSIPGQTKNYAALNKDVEKFKSLTDVNIMNANKCIREAREAMSIEDFERAKRLLLRAEHYYPTDEALQLLFEVHKVLNQRSYQRLLSYHQTHF